MLQITIGNAYYSCSCVRYVTPEDSWLIVGVAAGAGLLLIITGIAVITTIVLVCRRRRNKPKEEADAYNHAAGSIELEEEEDKYYSTIPDSVFDNNANDYCRPSPVDSDGNRVYTPLSPPEPTNNTSPFYLTLKGYDMC